MPNKEVYIKNYKVEKEYSSAANFDGANDYINIPHNAKFNLSLFTLEGWFKWSVVDTNFRHLITKVVGSNTTSNFQWGWQNGNMRARITVGASIQDVNTTFIPQVDRYYHLAWVKSATISYIYINGALVNSGSHGTPDLTTTPVKIGARDDLAANQSFAGNIQEVRIWNHARTAYEINQNKNVKLQGNESGLVGYYRLNEGSGTSAVDLSPSPVNGTLTNFSGNYWASTSSPIYKRTYKGLTEYQFNSITSNLNSGYGDVSFQVPKKFDDFGLDETSGLDGYESEIVVYDQGQLTGQTIFKGELVKMKRSLSNQENVEIVAVAPVFRLEKTPLTANGSHTVTLSNQDPRSALMYIIDQFRSLNNIGIIPLYTVSSSHNSLDFGGSQYVSLPALGLSGNQSHTVEAIIKMDSYAANYRFIFAMGTGSIRQAIQLCVSNTGRLLYGFFTDDIETSGTVIELGKTYHVAGRWDPTTGLASIWINGVKIVEGSKSALNLANSNYNIGWRQFVDTESKFDGKIAEMKIWNVARTDNEIYQWHNRELDSTEIAKASLVAYYKLNDGSGTAAINSKGSNNGTLTNFSGVFWTKEVFGPSRNGDSLTPPFTFGNYSFNNATCLDAIQTIFKSTPTDFVWFIDVDGVVYLKQVSNTPNHYFFLGKDIISVSIDESKLEIVNDLAFWDGGSIAREYKNQSSIDKYGLFFDKKRDDRFSNTSAIDSYGRRIVNTYSTPNLQLEITILDSNAGGYDLESIKVGDTCKILNIADTSGLSNNMLITKKVDYLDYAVLTIADVASYTSRELYNLKKDQQMVNYDSGPATYTVV